MGNCQDHVVVLPRHDLLQGPGHPRPQLQLPLSAEGLKEVSIGQLGVQTLVLSLKDAEIPLLEPLDPDIGRLKAGGVLQGVAGPLGGGGVGVVKGDMVFYEVLSGQLGLPDPQLRKGGVAPALNFVLHVEQRLAVAHQIERLFHVDCFSPSAKRFQFFFSR